MPLLFETVARTLEELEPITGRIQMTNLLAGLLGQAGPDEIAPLSYLIQGRLAPEYRQNEFGVNEKLALRGQCPTWTACNSVCFNQLRSRRLPNF